MPGNDTVRCKTPQKCGVTTHKRGSQAALLCGMGSGSLKASGERSAARKAKKAGESLPTSKKGINGTESTYPRSHARVGSEVIDCDVIERQNVAMYFKNGGAAEPNQYTVVYLDGPRKAEDTRQADVMREDAPRDLDVVAEAQPGTHLGQPITFDDLPEDMQEKVAKNCRDTTEYAERRAKRETPEYGGYKGNMKMDRDTYEGLSEKVRDAELRVNFKRSLAGLPSIRDAYRSGDFARSEGVKDLDTRFQYDLLHASGGRNALYDRDLDDSHISTALRTMIPEL